MSLPEQAKTYFDNHLINLPDNGHRPAGISLMAQTRFWDNWREELESWKGVLPN